ncbi:FimV/HubP family polar landmark protein [Trinickia sp. NRRL B-1857]|uniref:FimV/HubP family polar landmark protein n=1 Tax=Trinickia sp. NRRL B-1857 TaxID=3162879 RepID=UPI003D2AE914
MTIRSTRRAVSLAIACAWLACASPAGAAAAAAPASAPVAQSAVPASAATQVAVKPGQSLADIAAAATGSHDKTVLGRAARAIFDANPSAFMRGDPSLLKLGAVLNVPALDATGAPAKTESAPAPAAASAPNTTSGNAAAAQAAASGAKASGVAPAKPASAAPAMAAVAPASTAAAASSAANVGAHPASAAAAAHAQPAVPSGASGAHAWSGAIEPAPVAPASAPAQASAGASGASAGAAASAPAPAQAPTAAAASQPAASGTAPTAAPAQTPAAVSAPKPGASASAAAAPAAEASHPKVSSLQQLLALKNRVLMELQRHGIGAPSASHSGAAKSASPGASGFAVSPASGPVSAPAPGQSRAAAAANQRFIGIGDYGVTLAKNQIPVVAAIVAAIVAALLVLLIALGVSRRRSARPADGAKASTASAARGAESAQAAATPAATPDDPIEAEFLAILARTPSSKRALMGLAAHYAERKNIKGFDEIAQRIYRLSGGRGPNWTHVASIGRQLDPDNPLFALEAGATEEGDLSSDEEGVAPEGAVVDLSTALPSMPPVTAAPPTQVDDVPAPIPHVAETGPEPEKDGAHAEGRSEGEEAHAEPVEAKQPEPHEPATAQEAQAPVEPQGEPTLPPEAVAALDGLDIGLPPRVGPVAETPAEPQPAAEGEPEREELETGLPTESTSTVQPQHEHADHEGHEGHVDHEDETEPPGEEPARATHVPSALPVVTGLGAAPVGRLNLSFDLDLPGSQASAGEAAQAEAEAQPPFTPEQLARIARNKLDLAAEYIALGDLGGARTLIHEVIESNDAATHADAHAMLATLAPLS